MPEDNLVLGCLALVLQEPRRIREIVLAADSDPERAAQAGRKRAASGHRSAPPRRTVSAISKSGHTRAGRVRQKSHKQAEMVSGRKAQACVLALDFLLLPSVFRCWAFGPHLEVIVHAGIHHAYL